VDSELSPQHSGFANPLYNQDAAAAAAAEGDSVRMDHDDGRSATETAVGFRPAVDESGNDKLQLVERDVND